MTDTHAPVIDGVEETNLERASNPMSAKAPWWDDQNERPLGRPAREVEEAARRLFVARGYENVSVEDLAAELGLSRESFDRHIRRKADVLWLSFDDEIASLAEALAAPTELPTVTAIREAILSSLRHRPEDRPGLVDRLDLLVRHPEVRAAAAERHEAWEHTITTYIGQHHPEAGPMLAPSIARSALALCRTAFEQWLSEPQAELSELITQAFSLLTDGFDDGDSS